MIVDARSEREIIPEQIAQLAHGPGDAHDLGCQTDFGLRMRPFEALVRLTHFPARQACFVADVLEDLDGQVGRLHGGFLRKYGAEGEQGRGGRGRNCVSRA